MTPSKSTSTPSPWTSEKSIDGLAALVELDIKVAVFDPVPFVFLNEAAYLRGVAGTQLVQR